MTPEIRSQLAAFGTELSPAMMGGTQSIFRPLQPGVPADVNVTRDERYGEDERNRLDVFAKPGLSGAPVLMFVHGGGFVMGDKTTEGSPFYDNIGAFAAASGYVGVTMTYRLAPAHRWPAGGEDVAAAVAWLRENVARFGGDPDRIFVMGQSAGAVHVAEAVTRFAPQIAGAILVSGIYDVKTAHVNDFQKAYYGDDAAAYGPASTMTALLTTKIPLLVTVCEFDPEDFQLQAGAFASRYTSTRKTYPPLHWLMGHNHLSPVLELGVPGSTLERPIHDFIAAA